MPNDFYFLSRYILDICDLQGDIITSPLGVVTSPNYPVNYPPNENCKVNFNSQNTEGYMLKFEGFQIGQRRSVKFRFIFVCIKD